MRALYSAASGMMAQQMNVDTISNNLANVNTIGFKKSRVEFKDLLYQTIQGGAANENGKPVAVQIGNGVMPVATLRNFTQGNVEMTENPLDVLVEGDGFFAVMGLNEQTYYTRDGSFKLGMTEDGYVKLVSSEGYSILDSNGNEIILDTQNAADINIDDNGVISYIDSSGTEVTADAPIGIFKFANRAGLESKGMNLYVATVASGEAINETELDDADGANSKSVIRQGFLETSNVQIVDEMVKLIVAQRAYEINSKSVQAADDMLGMANNLKR